MTVFTQECSRRLRAVRWLLQCENHGLFRPDDKLMAFLKDL